MNGRLTWKATLTGNHHHAFNEEDEEVGSLDYQRVGRFMHWVWYQEPSHWMSAGCLDEVRRKQKELYASKRKSV